jgi:hypothetical protein
MHMCVCVYGHFYESFHQNKIKNSAKEIVCNYGSNLISQ